MSVVAVSLGCKLWHGTAREATARHGKPLGQTTTSHCSQPVEEIERKMVLTVYFQEERLLDMDLVRSLLFRNRFD
jgi:hypothetical protein